MAVLITYFYQPRQGAGWHVYDIASSATAWLDEVQQHTDGRYFLINALEITEEQAVEYAERLNL